MSTKTSIILPSIRPQNLKRWYDAAALACKNNPWEVIIVSPYNLPAELDNISNIKYLRSDRNPTICKQMGCLLASGEYLFNTTDDAILKPGSIDAMVDLYRSQSLGYQDIVNARYREGALDINTLEPVMQLPAELPPEYWIAHHHASLRLPCIQRDRKISLHFFMKLSTFYDIGGLNCNGYEYSVFPILEMCFRLQNYGGKIVDSTDEVSWCSHAPNHQSDHGPVHDAMQQNDEPLFQRDCEKNILNLRIQAGYNHWKRFDKKWARRFK